MEEKSTKEKTVKGCARIIGIIIILIIVFIFMPRPKTTDSPIVYQSKFDASVSQVVNYLQSNLKDPNSYESISWSNLTNISQNNNENYYWMVRHKYRAKNSFGGYNIEDQAFYLDSLGNILDIRNLAK